MNIDWAAQVLRCALAAVLIFGGNSAAFAEGRCPPGQYPIGGQGAGGCAPIPAGGSGAESPRPTGRWIKTWGAFAASPSGIAGAASGWRKKADAGNAAVRSCSDAGGRDCRVKFTYKNQCATAAVSNTGNGGTFYSAAATKEEAAGLSLAQCRAGSKETCEIVMSNCTEPEFEKF
ncbi:MULTISPECIES: DUF4189 domain-containing protein [Stenotrophomonas]|uniref:DUF4189 domain-containing protein n=1 Tax=Stenotrophomonas TaxID=40323 RepID=UPI00129962BC|nr:MULTISPECIES: DUF4189 domain-containing protein [Stenotrophomonas]MCM2994369.1 DUF4189 domain-containing protein [Stenotrophomonas maltophilia]MCR1820686.1 DUF4189 domain-containing protein [Stenotrophomonas muris]MDG9975314.1 DUF4189 domain-containing protein [Stenotrophomonas sp. GD04032]MDH1244610.1 DUF4189 domain-containing protein [Stenotrophomonas sp. GD03948]MDH1578452.1 DUF4189 domain-containing protein [Stenotrophomonas sp. GD03744]